VPARAAGKVRKEHSGFQKVMQKGGVWEIVKGRGRAVTQPPQWLWDGLAAFAPEVEIRVQIDRSQLVYCAAAASGVVFGCWSTLHVGGCAGPYRVLCHDPFGVRRRRSWQPRAWILPPLPPTSGCVLMPDHCCLCLVASSGMDVCS